MTLVKRPRWVPATTMTTYKIVPFFTADSNNRLGDMLPYTEETGARTDVELVDYVLGKWLVERDFFARGLYCWLIDRGMKGNGWRDALELEEEHVERIRVEVATVEGRAEFLAAIQSDPLEPVFFVMPGCGNVFLTEFVLGKAMGAE